MNLMLGLVVLALALLLLLMVLLMRPIFPFVGMFSLILLLARLLLLLTLLVLLAHHVLPVALPRLPVAAAIQCPPLHALFVLPLRLE